MCIRDRKDKIQRNTLQFVQGLPANNVLLTGARGTGKSSLVKACLNEYAPQGLRLIEVDKADLVDLPDIVDVVADRPERFVVFCDDLSFEDGEAGYKALKSILDGSVSAAGHNVLIVATSNRRHLLPEYMKENLSYTHTPDGEVHPGEVVEEKSPSPNVLASGSAFIPSARTNTWRSWRNGWRRLGFLRQTLNGRVLRPWSGRWSAAHAAVAWPTSLRATTLAHATWAHE